MSNVEFKKIITVWNKGIKGSIKPNITSFKPGQIPWNKGIKGGNSHSFGNCFRKGFPAWNKGIPNSGFKKGMTAWNKNIPMSSEIKDKISKTLKGRKSPNFKVGYYINPKGYKFIWINEKIKYIREHRYVMEKHIGRKLKPYELVHHKDGNKINNSIENLEIMSFSAHSTHHQPKILGKIKKCSVCNKYKKLHSIKYSCCNYCYKHNYLYPTA